MSSTPVRFQGALGDTVAGLVDLPAGTPRAFGVFAHCFTCSKNLRIAPELAKQLNAEGFGVLRFDFTGLGQSEGEFEKTTFRTNTRDVIAAAQFLAKEYEAPQFLIGHSLGGAAVLSVAGELPSVRCVATIAAPSEPQYVRGLIEGAVFNEEGLAEVEIDGRPFPIGRPFLDDLETHDVPAQTRRLGRPLLIMHAPSDRVVGIEHAERIFKAAQHPKSYISLDNADHLLSDPRDAAFAGHMISAWAGRYVGRAGS